MNKQNTSVLLTAFPQLFFKDSDGVATVARSAGYPYFACGDGWFALLWETLSELEIARSNLGIQVNILQVKEKFGQLVVYIDVRNDELNSILAKAYEKSMNICIDCGETPATIRHYAWLRPLCDSCNVKAKVKIVDH